MRNVTLILMVLASGLLTETSNAQSTWAQRADRHPVTRVQIEEALQLPWPKLELKGEQSLEKVLNAVDRYLEKESRVPSFFWPDKASLELDGITSLSDVSVGELEFIDAGSVSVEKGLRLIFEQTTEPELDFVVDHGYIMITTKSTADTYLETRFYDLSSFLINSSDGYDNSSLFELIEQQTSGMDCEWINIHGTGGVMSPHGQFVAIRQTRIGHDKVADLLRLFSYSMSGAREVNFQSACQVHGDGSCEAGLGWASLALWFGDRASRSFEVRRVTRQTPSEKRPPEEIGELAHRGPRENVPNLWSCPAL